MGPLSLSWGRAKLMISPAPVIRVKSAGSRGTPLSRTSLT